MNAARLKKFFEGINNYHSGSAEYLLIYHQTDIGYKNPILHMYDGSHNEYSKQMNRDFFLSFLTERLLKNSMGGACVVSPLFEIGLSMRV
jgi:Tat protein secretion system quality control protein TatD with DNase activity